MLKDEKPMNEQLQEGNEFQEEKRLDSKRKVKDFIDNLDKYCREEYYLEDME